MPRSFRHSYDVQVQRPAVQTKRSRRPPLLPALRSARARPGAARSTERSLPRGHGRPLRRTRRATVLAPSCVMATARRGQRAGGGQCDDMRTRPWPGRRDGGRDMRTRTCVRRARIDGTAAAATTRAPLLRACRPVRSRRKAVHVGAGQVSVLVPAGAVVASSRNVGGELDEATIESSRRTVAVLVSADRLLWFVHAGVPAG